MSTNVIYKGDSEFPELLRHTVDAPAHLYYKGTWGASLFENCLAVVGSRRMTQYGKKATEQIVGQIAAAGVTIVSGFMYGVDAASHKAALSVGGKTIAVMPCGIERVHPAHQKDLYEEIIGTGGLVVSEWEGSGMPQMFMYPKRNRIVAGVSKATLVVEAGLESGSLITAALAKKFGRAVLAVPGPITSSVSAGTNQLIQQGASLVTSADEVLELFDRKGLFAKQEEKASVENPVEEKILDILHREALEVDLLARTLQIPAAELGTTLSLMELRGVINQEGGKYYIK